MKILSIETSCDDTCISIMEMHGSFSARGGSAFGGKVLANNSNSQINIHIPYGGVYPVLAKREHEKNLPIILDASLKQVKLNSDNRPVDPIRGREGSQQPSTSNGINVIAVTYGPGLEMSLWTGITFAKELAKKWNVPLIPVNHMEGHILSVFASPVAGLRPRGKNKIKFKIPKTKLPILSLLVSGGHTQLVLSKKWMQYEIIGESVDDAVGEAFDKVARMLGLPYPGGPQISKLAENVREKENKTSQGRNFSTKKFAQSSGRHPTESPQSLFSFSLPRPMLHSKNFNFSFSGLKTAVLYLIRDLGGIEEINEKTKAQIALEFENAAIECLVYKTAKAIEKYKIKTLIVAGGVAANKYLKNEMQKITTAKAGQAGKKIRLFFPTRELSGDNSLMIGMAGYLNYIKNKKKVPKFGSIKATGNLRL